MSAAAIRYLDGLGRFADLGLGRIDALCARLGRPERRLGAIHVAGTNGKGSVSAFAASILWHAGVDAGLYTSPSLQDPSERVVVSGRRISGQDLAVAADAVRRAAAAMEDPPTAFEAWTAVAFLHFARLGVPAAVVEVGLGGRWDATSVLDRPRVSVLTTVHRDHMAQLGRTLSAIAKEKAAIFRPGVPAVVGRLAAAARQVAASQARSVGAPLFALGREILVRPRADTRPDAPAFDLALQLGAGPEVLQGLVSGLAGAHQMANAALAVAAVRLAQREGGPRVTERAIRDGLRQAVWPGRLERAGDVLLDGAHNLEGARALAGYLRAEPGPTIWVVGGTADRPPGDVLGPLLPFARAVVASGVPTPRSRGPSAWRAAIARRGVDAEQAPDAATALATARRMRRRGERILVAGSLYLVGEARTALSMPPPWPEGAAHAAPGGEPPWW